MEDHRFTNYPVFAEYNVHYVQCLEDALRDACRSAEEAIQHLVKIGHDNNLSQATWNWYNKHRENVNKIREDALEKLTKEEKEALGLSDTS